MTSPLVDEIAQGPIPHLVSKWIMERTPFIFKDDHLSFLQWKAKLAKELGVDSCSLIFTGTASVGISLNPYKNWKAFDSESDVDVAVISLYYFEESWRFFRNLGSSWLRLKDRERAIIKEHVDHYVYWGTIATDKILHVLPFGKQWQRVLADMARIPPTEGRDIKVRIYRDFESLRSYHIRNLKNLQRDLLTRRSS
jgi:hypothetical protein